MKPRTRWLHVSWILLLGVFADSLHNHQGSGAKRHNDRGCDTKSACDTSVPCACCGAQQVKVTFSTKIVENEYIVAFKGYYKPHTRKNYIGAALNSSGVNNWTILHRDNLASRFPSDFDIVLLQGTVRHHGLNALSNHPLIRRVTPQRLVRRSLNFINTTRTDDSDVPEYRDLRRQANTHVSMQIVACRAYKAW